MSENENLNNVSVSVLLKTYENDFERACVCIDSFIRHCISEDIKLHICLPRDQMDKFQNSVEAKQLNINKTNISIMHDDALVGEDDVFPENLPSDRGYYEQALIKLKFGLICESDYYLAIDSDCIFIRDFDESVFFVGSECKPKIVFSQYRDLELSPWYYKTWSEARISGIQKIYDLFGLDYFENYSNHNCQLMSVAALKYLRSRLHLGQITSNGKPFRSFSDLLTYSPFEFSWHNAALISYKKVKFVRCEPYFLVLTDRRQWAMLKIQGVSQERLGDFYLGICLNSKWKKPWKTPLQYGGDSSVWKIIRLILRFL